MRICFVAKGTLERFSQEYGGSDADVVFFGFNGADSEIAYDRELKGETSYFEDAAILSKTCKNVVVCACVTDTRGLLRKSVVVAEKGRILGVSDMLNCMDGKYNPGAGLRVYETGVGRLGVCVSEDAYFSEIFRTLSVCGSEIVFCPFLGTAQGVEGILLRAAAFSYGTPICFCSAGYSFVADVDGSAAFSSPLSPVEFCLEQKKEYHLIETRRKGFYQRERKDF